MAEAKRDGNYVPTLIGVSSVDGVTPVTVYVDPVTHRLYVDATGGTGTVTSIATGTGLTGGTITTTGTISLDTPLQPIATLTGNAGKFLRVNAGETAVEYAVVSGSGTVTSVSVVTANGFAGTVATDTTTPAITITTSLTDGSIPFASSSAFSQNNANFFWNDANTRLIVGGNTTDYTAVATSYNLVKTGAATFIGAGYGASSGGLYLGLRANGTPGSATGIASGNILNSLGGAGYDGTAWITASRGGMRVVASENWSNTAHGTQLIFATTPNTTTTAGDVMVLSQAGNLTVGSSSVSSSRLSISTTRSASYPATTNFSILAGTFTDTSSSGTVTSIIGAYIDTTTLVASSATTYTSAASVYIASAPVASTNVTITNNYALWVGSGTTRLGGSLNLSGQTASTIAILDASKNVISATTATYPDLTELSYLKGVTSAIQTQLNSKGTGNGTVTSVGFTGGIISVATATTTPAFTVAGTSGGIPYFSSASTWASSAALTANAIVIGGGAGVAPSTTTTGTGVLTALGINVGSAGAFVTFNGALGTPSSGTVTNLTGTASININGTVGATTPTTATFTTVTVNTGITLAENASIALDPAGSADGKYTGITVTGTAGYTQAFGDLVYLAVADSRWELADADASATAGPVALAMVVSPGTDGTSCTLLLQGIIRADAKFPTMTVGATQFVGETAGAIQGAIPTGADNIIRTVGYAITADELYFNPSTDWQVTVA